MKRFLHEMPREIQEERQWCATKTERNACSGVQKRQAESACASVVANAEVRGERAYREREATENGVRVHANAKYIERW